MENALPPLPLPPGVRARHVDTGTGLDMHVLEAGFETPGRPVVLLLHGFPELAWSWRKVMLPLAAAGYRVIAPDQRGYGRTTGWDGRYDGDLASFDLLNLVRDQAGNLLVYKGLSDIGQQGETVTLKATVKEHNIRDGVQQTVIQRPKVMSEA